jgi:hypothetical protein
MEGNVLPSHADVAAPDFTILDEPSGNKLCRIIEFRISKGTIPHRGHGKSEA